MVLCRVYDTGQQSVSMVRLSLCLTPVTLQISCCIERVLTSSTRRSFFSPQHSPGTNNINLRLPPRTIQSRVEHSCFHANHENRLAKS